MVQKKVSITLLDEAKEEYLMLQETARAEKGKGIESSFNQTLLKSIDSKIELLKANYDYGVQIPRKLIPTEYIRKYGITNLWKVNLSGYWRMIYTLRQLQRDFEEVEIISILLDVLDIVDHKKYDKIFGYKKK
ncbi:MAG TPA: hypothetical protein VFF13_06500 [archaeon]|nr:hypothetical protein [archaeon]